MPDPPRGPDDGFHGKYGEWSAWEGADGRLRSFIHLGAFAFVLWKYSDEPRCEKLWCLQSVYRDTAAHYGDPGAMFQAKDGAQAQRAALSALRRAFERALADFPEEAS